MTVKLVTETSAKVLEDLNRLLPELSQSAKPLSEAQAHTLTEQPGIYLFMDYPEDGGNAQGMLTLVTFTIPTGLRAIIEDVVVAKEARGRGVGQSLVEAALGHARKIGCKTVDLTSRPSREAANRLYRRCGFEPRDTNVYRFEIN